MQTAPRVPGQVGINFLKYRYMFLFLSVVYFVVGVAAYMIRGGFTYHIDFTGGTEVRISFQSPLETGTLRTILTENGWKDSVIQSVGTKNQDFLIRIGDIGPDIEERINRTFNENITTNAACINNIQRIGAEAGKDTTKNAIIAILISLFILLLYIAFRFEFRFGIGAVVCLLHDILAVMVFLVLTGEAISLHVLASILAVLGYSLNDTIVIFAKIRENMHKLKGVSEYDITNLSLNQTLGRTLLTSFATLLAVLAIFFLGGETLRSLSLVMLIGIIVGTYSSIYIASPVMLSISKRK